MRGLRILLCVLVSMPLLSWVAAAPAAAQCDAAGGLCDCDPCEEDEEGLPCDPEGAGSCEEYGCGPASAGCVCSAPVCSQGSAALECAGALPCEGAGGCGGDNCTGAGCEDFCAAYSDYDCGDDLSDCWMNGDGCGAGIMMCDCDDFCPHGVPDCEFVLDPASPGLPLHSGASGVCRGGRHTSSSEGGMVLWLDPDADRAVAMPGS